MKKTLLIIMLLSPALLWAQKQKKQDVASIKSMCGCYKVYFNFAETFSPKRDYEFHENYKSHAYEWVTMAEEDDDKLSLQHLLVIRDTMIIKHWRQDWLYENTDLYTYDKDKTWKPVSLSKNEVKGQWSQKVYQVDDGPRYEGSATWIHADGRDYWENTTDAPLPRREYTKRDDYNVMKRRNRQEITEEGWIHEQDNDKVLRDGEDQLIAQEKGWNTYTKVEDSKCSAAKAWWDTYSAYWADVRAVWDEVYESKKTLALKTKVEDQFLYEQLFALQEDYKGEHDSEKAKATIKKVIQPYIESDIQLASN
ncbi:hypothetical protein LVD15_18905 [Fulvivirga maritima]|uniref:DUF6607 family protein n=1 Tax=Fulvivirga maritima TaxID=2904247 RepID=UPI001F3568CE|nr:DUF6607 family protein [Fulvivirga maritima]UII25356.1 hypothetical protein LVD15_18905 [Fulvivirga maritima]